MSVNSKGIAVHNYVHLVNLHFHQLKKNLIKLQSAVILPSNDIDQSLITSPGEGESEKLQKGVEVWFRGRSSGKGEGAGICPIFLKVYQSYI